MLRPQAKSRRSRDTFGSSVTTFISVSWNSEWAFRFAEPTRQPTVVDDPDLRVHVHGIAEISRPRVDRAGEEAGRLVGCVDECGHLPARDVRAVVRPGRQQDEDAEVVRRRVPQLVREDGDDLGRPEELVLEIDEPLGRARARRVRLEDRVLAAAHRTIGAGRKRPHDLRLDVTASSDRVGPRQELARRSVPAQAEVLRDVRDGRALDPHGGVVPADPAPRDVRRRVPRIAPVEREVDAAHERDPPVDHDGLLVVAVRKPRAAVGVRLDLRMARERVEHLSNLAVRRLEQWQRSALPREHPHVDALRELGEQVAHDHRLVVSREMQLRREEPAGEVDVRLGARELGRDRRQSLRTVHENLESVAWACRKRFRWRYSNPEASRACSQPTCRSRCRWRLRTARSSRSPNACPSLTVVDSRNRGVVSRAGHRVCGPRRTSCAAVVVVSLRHGVRRRPPAAPRARARPPPRSTRGLRASPPRNRCTPACRSARARRG